MAAFYMERGRRIELLTLDWKSKVIPFYEPRVFFTVTSALLTDILEAVADIVLQLGHAIHNNCLLGYDRNRMYPFSVLTLCYPFF
jgi:hypothetical protein